MRSHFFVVLVSVAVAVAIVTGAAAANETATNDTNATTADDAGELIDAGDDPTVMQEIDDYVRLLDYEYSDGTFTLWIEADASTGITLTEAVQFEEGAGSGSIRQHRLSTGTNEIQIDVDAVNGEAAVTMTTPMSMSQGRFVWVSTGQTETDRPPIAYGSAMGAILLTALGTGYYSFRRSREIYEDDDDPEVGRIA